MQQYLLIDENGRNGLGIHDTCMANSESHARSIFTDRGWSLCLDILSEFDYLRVALTEAELNSLESQSAEC